MSGKHVDQSYSESVYEPFYNNLLRDLKRFAKSDSHGDIIRDIQDELFTAGRFVSPLY